MVFTGVYIPDRETLIQEQRNNMKNLKELPARFSFHKHLAHVI
jgi:hypothetical protein